MQIQQNVSLKPYNTFGIDVTAERFLIIDDIALLTALSDTKKFPFSKHVLGGGSNVLLTKPVEGIVLLNRLKGISIEKENDEHVWLKAMAGEVWHELVLYAINNGWAGIENLALIPGRVGAAPMQNIGAYGMEAKETIESVTCWSWEKAAMVTYKNSECHFGYRDSIFKHELKDKVLITSVIFKLNKKPVFNTTYGAIEQELHQSGIKEPSIEAIAEAVIAIRTSKLPDPKQIGNAGSFFKNPTITQTQFKLLQATYPDMPHYNAGQEMVKVPAGWLIEQCGWKGYKKDNYGVHARQALVLVNYGGANGQQIWQLSGDILQSVKERFNITLEREVQVW